MLQKQINQLLGYCSSFIFSMISKSSNLYLSRGKLRNNGLLEDENNRSRRSKDGDDVKKEIENVQVLL